MKTKMMVMLLLFGIVLCVAGQAPAGERFRIAIMQDQSGVAQKYAPLIAYLSKKGVDAAFVTAQDYPAAAGMFSIGGVDGMFSGSGVAGFMIMKNVAKPTVRPVSKQGYSTYWAVIVAKKGAPKFNGTASYFNGKKLAFTTLASSGDFYYHSLPGADHTSITEIKLASHGDCIESVNKGQADYAIVKNRVWDSVKEKYPNLVIVGEDKGENPDGTLIVSSVSPPALSTKVAGVLLGLREDQSQEAMDVKKSLGIQGFVKTTIQDFDHTLALLKKADVTKRFNVAP